MRVPITRGWAYVRNSTEVRGSARLEHYFDRAGGAVTRNPERLRRVRQREAVGHDGTHDLRPSREQHGRTVDVAATRMRAVGERPLEPELLHQACDPGDGDESPVRAHDDAGRARPAQLRHTAQRALASRRVDHDVVLALRGRGAERLA